MPSLPPSVADPLLALGAIGDRPSDDERARLQHRLLVYMGLLMSLGGLLWGSLAAAFHLWRPAVIPYGYAVVTCFNLFYFWRSKDFPRVRWLQVFVSLLLPFLFQWSLGGFAVSGAVMLWAMLALVGSLTFSSSRESVAWLLVYIALTAVSGFVDPWVAERFSNNPPEAWRTAFHVINITVISAIVFGLTIYLLGQRESSNAALARAAERVTQLNEHLEDEVTARTEALEAALGQSRAILDNLADGLVAIDRAGRVQALNPALARLLQVDDSAIGQPAPKLLPSNLVRLAETCCAQDEVTRVEVHGRRKRTLAAVASPIHKGEGVQRRCVGAVLILRDVTIEKEVDRMKTDFIATVSHELRTPLTSVLGFAKLIQGKLDRSVFPHVPDDDRKARRAVGQVQDNVAIIISEGERLTELIGDVLDISKMEAGRMEWRHDPIDPGALVQRAVQASAGLFEGRPVALVSEIEEDLPTLVGDRDRLMQVVINLLSNASKFTREGSVTVRTSRCPEGVQIEVKDTGPGIPSEQHSTIFEKFRQAGDTLTDRPTGTGLGLPICEQIVRAHRGRIGVTSELGEGATFRVVLPVEEMDLHSSGFLHPLDPNVASLLPEAPEAPLDILVADDDANLRALLKEQLQERGFRVRLASDGAGAVGLARAWPPDALVLDLVMPELSGHDVAAILRGDPRTRDVPIIVLSVIDEPERLASLGVQGFLTKPADPDELASRLRRAVARKT